MSQRARLLRAEESPRSDGCGDGRQQLISKPVRVRTSSYGDGGGNGGGGRHSGSYGHGGA
ncbi:hypothetical protein S96127_4305 (plasmid) [Yersinia pestis]|uniref:hypothetical protein n=1 Tax=Yersinia pestis TaxID=632 RepID=UPI0018A47746|nr:hypothetical protein S96127_4305 [Yersinia pestis]